MIQRCRQRRLLGVKYSTILQSGLDSDLAPRKLIGAIPFWRNPRFRKLPLYPYKRIAFTSAHNAYSKTKSPLLQETEYEPPASHQSFRHEIREITCVKSKRCSNCVAASVGTGWRSANVRARPNCFDKWKGAKRTRCGIEACPLAA